MFLASLFASIVKLFCGCHAQWRGSEPSLQQRIYYANHTSNLDFVVVWASLPSVLREITRPVAARDYWTASSLRCWLALNIFRAVLIERKKVTATNHPVMKMLEGMGSDQSLIIFPEGGRKSGEGIDEFKSGIFHLARKLPGVELIPVFIDNANRVLPKGEVLPVPMLCSIHFGKAIQLQLDERREDFLARARQAILELRNS
jgi:1-acyl-sn-glycerol-3-phosphate acyltransferase